MFHIFVSGSLQSKEGEFWNQVSLSVFMVKFIKLDHDLM